MSAWFPHADLRNTVQRRRSTDTRSATATHQGPQQKEPQKTLFSGGFLSKALAQALLERSLGEEA